MLHNAIIFICAWAFFFATLVVAEFIVALLENYVDVDLGVGHWAKELRVAAGVSAVQAAIVLVLVILVGTNAGRAFTLVILPPFFGFKLAHLRHEGSSTGASVVTVAHVIVILLAGMALYPLLAKLGSG